MYGTVGSKWTIENGRFTLAVVVPANARATVTLPSARLGDVVIEGEGIAAARQAPDSVVLEIGSGDYRFSYPMR